ncbi:MAG: glycosyltransferase family 39 protein [Chitinophagaceae bacterium]
MATSNRLHTYLRILLFAVYFINGIIVINLNSVASDETDHMYYGLRMLKGQPQKINPYEDGSTMPISAFNALPRGIEQILHPGLTKTDGGISDAIHGRYMTLLICVLAGFFVYRWSKEMFGEKAGLFSLFLFVFCPNLQANIPLVGTDAYAMLFTLSSAYYFRKFILYSGWRNFILFSIQIGLAQIAKQSLFLLPIFFGVMAVILLLQRGSLIERFKINIGRLAVFTLIVLFIINIAFLFNGTGQSLIEYHFRSDTFLHIQQWQLINRIPLPLPVPFIDGFDMVKHMLSMGSGNPEVSGRSYLLGNYFTGNALWYYYSVIILFKTPLTVLLMLAAVFIAYFKNPFSKTNFFATGFTLLLAFFFLIFISLNNTSQHGLRHLLMIYPLFYVCLGQLMTWKLFQSKITLTAIVAYSLVTFYFYFPNLLSYTNELIWDKKNAYKVLASTNIDHGQCNIALTDYLSNHTDIKWPGSVPVAGEFILGINEYLDVKMTGKYTWLRNFKPYDHVDHCYLLFRISETDLLQKHLK